MSFHPIVPYGPQQHQSERKLPEMGPPFAFTAERRERFETIASRYPPDQRRSAILPALYLAQEQHGFITGHAMRHVAEVIGCSAADVEDVVSFYTMFHAQPVGKYVIYVCRTLSCALLGAEHVTEALSRKLGIKLGQTDATGTFTLLEAECLGACDRAPVLMINDDWHERLGPEDAGRLLDELRARGPDVLSGCHLCVERSR